MIPSRIMIYHQILRALLKKIVQISRENFNFELDTERVKGIVKTKLTVTLFQATLSYGKSPLRGKLSVLGSSFQTLMDEPG